MTGVKEVIINLRKTCRIEEIILLNPNKIGLKNTQILRMGFGSINAGSLVKRGIGINFNRLVSCANKKYVCTKIIRIVLVPKMNCMGIRNRADK
jgi:hypothetical protein